MLSEACKNAIRAVVYLATQDDPAVRCTVHEVAEAIAGPEAFVAKIMQSLRKADIISATKGPNGGMYITAKQAQRPILDVVKEIDGLHAFKQCGLGLPKCNASRPCPVHHDYALLRDALLHRYAHTSIHQLAHSVNNGTAVLHR